MSVEDTSVSERLKFQSELISAQYHEIQLLKSEQRCLNSKICALEGKIDRMTTLLEGVVVNKTSFSPQKKRKIDDGSDNIGTSQGKGDADPENIDASAVVEMSNVYVGKYRLESLKGITLAELMCAYYIHNLAVEVNLDADPTLRSKFNSVTRYLLTFCTKANSSEINSLKPFKTLESRKMLQIISEEMSAAAMADLASREGLEGPSRHKPYVEGVLKRLNALSKTERTTTVKQGPMDSFINRKAE
jgi:hypothetical protein